MGGKFFSKDIRKACLWCIHGRKSEYTDEVFCVKRGITSAEDYCRKYKYDPLKRTPEVQTIDKDYKAEDFSLNID